MKTSSPLLIVLCGAMAAAMPALAQNTTVCQTTADSTSQTQSTWDQLVGILALKIDKAITSIPDTETNPAELTRRKALQKLQDELKKEGGCANLKSISDEFDKISKPKPPVRALTIPPVNPANNPSTTIDEKSISLALKGMDSFNREVSATATIQYNFGKQPEGKIFTGKLTPKFYDLASSEYIFNVSASYDDKWKAAPSKPGAANYSSLTQQYAGEVLQLSNLFNVHTVIFGSAYHDNSQGVIYDVEPGLGVYLRWNGKPVTGKSAPACTTNGKPAAPPPPKYQAILGLSAQADIDLQSTDAHATTLGGLNTYLLLKQTSDNAKNTVGFNLRGFLPAIETAANGHASAIVTDDYKFTDEWSLSFSVLDTYYSTVPATYSHNSLTPTIGVKFTPKAGK